ncbi:MAG: hypothetical protein JXA69_17630, partial [Phycisphaerae bacterium]|nr:hypothetical protein [Phycisphaerae bacterium]
MKWCCAQFEFYVQRAGERGIGVFADASDESRPAFFVQFRAVDYGVEASVTCAAPVSMMVEVGILRCPWCGADLQKWYRKRIGDLNKPHLRVQ